jgi:hypothetical protein
MKKSLLVLSSLMALVLFLRTPFVGNSHQAYHSAEEISFYKAHFSPPLDSGEYFSLPQNCKGCHGFDSLGLANVDINGMDVNLYDDWETSMMGLSGVDPFWKAKVSHETLVNPSHAAELQDLCTSCHAPLGHYTAMYKGQPHYSMADLALDSLGQSGVSCHSCHGIKDSSDLGSLFTGQIPYDTNRIVYGPFTQPMVGPMQLYVGLIPAYGPHLSESRACSPCHTLISNAVDLNGNATGTSFVEQATYHEYLNSDYPDVEQLTCQSCHMPKIEDPIKIANGYTALPGRAPFNLHTFTGANTFMVQLIKDNKAALGVTAEDKNFDSTLQANTQMLRFQTLDLFTSYDSTYADTAYFSLRLVNKAGHKFPSGYPSRRAVVQFVALKPNGDTLFASGIFDNNYEVKNINTQLEPHHRSITNAQQAQVYEMVMGDVNGDRTTVLERGYSHLKDNRIPPKGFTTLHPVYDTCAIVGDALLDPDFNKINGTEGSGQDIVRYHLALNGYNGPLNVFAHVYYQTLPPAFLAEMQNYSSAAIDTFLSMYNAANKTPMLVAADTLSNLLIPVGTDDRYLSDAVKIGPNPTADGLVYISNLAPGTELTVYSLSGQKISTTLRKNGKNHILQLPEETGVYYLVVRNGRNRSLHKILRTH